MIVVGIFLVGQFLEGYILSPKLVGAKVGLHPVWLMFALLAFGYLFGFVGLLVAVPLAAAIGVLVRFALRQYLASPLYTGRQGRADVPGRERHRERRHRRRADASLRSRSTMPRASRARISWSGPSNAAALALIERWPDWPSRTVLLRGPEGSGKSHLAAIWAREAGARMLSPRDARGRRGAGRARDRRAGARGSRRRPRSTRRRCSICSTSRARSGPLCSITARTRAGRLADRSCPISPRGCARCRWWRSTAPDDALLRAVIVKLFADRQLAVDESLVGYLATRIERSFAGARGRRSRARPGGAAPQAAGHPGAGRGAVPRSLDVNFGRDADACMSCVIASRMAVMMGRHKSVMDAS